jgi:hypothetical protein
VFEKKLVIEGAFLPEVNAIETLGFFIPYLYMCICKVNRLARQISVSKEVYELLLEKKGKRSFSEVIK